jgi:hypothetical protein
VLGLVLRELEEETLRHGKYGEPQALDMRQDLDYFWSLKTRFVL